MSVRGACLCGGVAFLATGLREEVIACHCSQCRRISGHHVAATSAALGNVTFTADASLRWYASSDTADRGFCGTCGSSLFWRPRGGDRLAISAGCLDAPTGLRLARHIFTADKGDYYAIDDDLPQFEGDG